MQRDGFNSHDAGEEEEEGIEFHGFETQREEERGEEKNLRYVVKAKHCLRQGWDTTIRQQTEHASSIVPSSKSDPMSY